MDKTNKINRCKYAYMDLVPPYCKKCQKSVDLSGKMRSIRESDCESCKDFDSRYIEYPVTINGIDYEANDRFSLNKPGLVKIRPCAEKYGDKTYLGLLVGDMPSSPHVSLDTNTKRLSVGIIKNPAIFVFKTKEIVYGCESWWQRIESTDQLTDITDDDINSQWYVEILKMMSTEGQNDMSKDNNT